MSLLRGKTNEWLTKIAPLLKLGFGGLEILWGIWVANPLWEAYPPTSDIFDLLRIIPESIIGTIVIVCGLFIFVSTLVTWTRPLLAAAFTSMLAWSFLSAGFFINDYTNLGGPVYLGFALFTAYLYVSESVVTQSERRTERKPKALT